MSGVNRLQRAREEYEAPDSTGDNPGRLIDLVDGSFHRAGFRFPPAIIQREFERYLAGPGYRPEAAGLLAAREAIAGYYGGGVLPGGAELPSAEQVILTASSSESYRLLFDALCDAGDSVLLPCPGYPLFEQLAEYSRVQPLFYCLRPEDAWLPEPAVLEGSLRAHALGTARVRAVVLISPNNPSGAVLEQARIAAIRQVAGRYGVVVILDEVFREFVYGPEKLAAGAAGAAGAAPLVRINGISKMFACPDIKLGWMLIPDAELYRRVEIAADVYLSASGPAQHLVPALFAEGMGFVSEMRGELERRRAVLLEELSSLPGIVYVPPRGGIHCIVQIPGLGVDDEEFAVRAVREAGVYLHPGYLYGIETGPSFVLSFLSAPETIRKGVARLRRVLRRY